MNSLRKETLNLTISTSSTTPDLCGDDQQSCTNPNCFFCAILKEQDLSIRRGKIATCLKEMPLKESQEHVLILSGIWNIAMTHPDDPELPSLGVFNSMSKLILKGTNDTNWLLSDQNIYIPYYAAHVIGSYTMNKVEFAEKAVESGVIPSLIELLRGKISWVEQRVAVRALGHLASYETTFDSVAVYEKELVKLAIELASTCLDTVYSNFVAVKDGRKRLKYQIDLLTRGAGGIELENRKAEEWASQLQCWSIYLLNCFACKERSLDIICKQDFLEDLCGIWGGLVNHSSPAGVGLIRILCYSINGRKHIAESEQVITHLCNLSRSSDDWQYIAIDCLVLLLRDEETRYKVIEIATFFLVDLVELRKLGSRLNVGETITKALISDIKKTKLKIKNKEVLEVLKDLWDFQLDRKREKLVLSAEKVEERRVLVGLIKQQGKHMFLMGEIEEAINKYSEALDVCPLRLRKERMNLYSNRAECYLVLDEIDAAISDSTRALCLSSPANSHTKSLWRRSQGYDMKGLAKESLMDCIMFLHCWINTETRCKRVKIPYSAARMITKQMDATWIFAAVKGRKVSRHVDEDYEQMMKRILTQTKSFISAGNSKLQFFPQKLSEHDSGRTGDGERKEQRKEIVAFSDVKSMPPPSIDIEEHENKDEATDSGPFLEIGNVANCQSRATRLKYNQLWKKRKQRVNSVSSREGKRSELDAYLDEILEEDVKRFDVLNWWKIHSARFPIIGIMARDILAMSVSTVASESALSTSMRIRKTLNPLFKEEYIFDLDRIQQEFQATGLNNPCESAMNSNIMPTDMVSFDWILVKAQVALK
ncbi:uncharacterized protein [Euphorbia lathyris]|uniref:uncharacterized protein n=1 Tax=Euphorbia lathyris TaxID=212925 RepID=UPI0033137D06